MNALLVEEVREKINVPKGKMKRILDQISSRYKVNVKRNRDSNNKSG